MNNKDKKIKVSKKQYDRGQVFVKVMAGILAVLMLAGTMITLVYALMG